MTPAAASTDDDASPPLRILLVEDDEFDVAVFARSFRQADIPCEIVRCRTGEEVLEGLRDAELAVDLLVTDHLLPGISGFDLCVELLRKATSFALVLLTGGGTEQMAIRALRAGINDYIVKDNAQEYLELLPLVLPKVARRHRERSALKLAVEQHSPHGAIEESSLATPGDGSAVGLSVCAAMVRQRGGRIWVEKGEGTVPTLHFAVPLAPTEADAWRAHRAAPEYPSQAAAAQADGAPNGDEAAVAAPDAGLHILIAHPNPIVTFVTTRSLERLGHRAVAVTDGPKAVEAIEREPFDMVFMAPRMPRADGPEATRQLRRREATEGTHLPIIALGVDAPDDLDRCREAGMDDHVPTPLGFESVRAALSRQKNTLK